MYLEDMGMIPSHSAGVVGLRAVARNPSLAPSRVSLFRADGKPTHTPLVTLASVNKIAS